MSELRAKPQDLCKGDGFQRHYQYRTTWPLAEVLHDKFFMPMRDYLFSGDTITLCRFDGLNPAMAGINLLEMATVMIISSGRQQQAVPLALIGDIHIIGDQQPAGSPYRVETGKAGKAKLMKGTTEIREYGSKSEADAEMKRLTMADA
jgi:hypothetical protein